MAKRKVPPGIDRYVTDIVFRPGYAVGLAYLRNPSSMISTQEAVEALTKALPGVDIRVDPKVDYLLLKLPDSVLRDVTEFAEQQRIARHDALVMLVKAGLAATFMVEQVNSFRELAIAEAVKTIRNERDKRSIQ